MGCEERGQRDVAWGDDARRTVEGCIRAHSERRGACLIWTSGLTDRGYGRLKLEGHDCRAHRVAYEAAYGAIAVGLCVRQRCGHRACVEPRHLELVTRRAAILHPSSQGLARTNADKQVCVQGHRLTGTNLYRRREGKGRDCKTCQRLASRRWEATRRG